MTKLNPEADFGLHRFQILLELILGVGEEPLVEGVVEGVCSVPTTSLTKKMMMEYLLKKLLMFANFDRHWLPTFF